MSGLFDQITNYSPPLLTAGQVNYKGTWSAAANSPTLTSPPPATSKGDYYVVSAAGTQFGITFAIGDWIISNGTAWEKVDLTDSVSSVFGRTGAVVSANGDYTASQVTNVPAGTISSTNVQDAINELSADIATAQNVLDAYVTNADSVTITKGQVVYAFGATGNRMSVKLANNSADATSAKTVGVVLDSSIAAGNPGYIRMVGVVDGLNLGAYNDGDTLYLGATAGSVTSTKPYAPNHLVYVGIVERANNGNGQLYVRVQNGYELDEIHDVQITSAPDSGALLVRDATNSLWKAARLTAGTNIAITNADASVTVGITGVIAGTNGGTGVNNGANTITIAGNVTHAGAFTQSFTATANTSLTLPVTGTLATLAGSEALSNKTITASAFNGTVGATTASSILATTIGATGAINTTATNASFYALGATTSARALLLANTGNSGTYIGVENSTGSYFGVTAYDSAVATPAGTGFSVQIGATGVVGRFSSTGLAVTGALSATGNAGIGTSSPDVFSRGYGRILGITSASNSAIEINSATGNGAYIDLGVNASRTASIYSDISSTDISTVGASRPITLSPSGSLIATVSSTGLAVSANNGSISLTRANGSFGLRIKQDNTLGEIAFQTKLSDDTTWQSYIKVGEGNSSANSHLILQPTAGNVGIGVTPSAWNSDYKVIQLGFGASIYGRVGNNETAIVQNWYRDSSGNFKYLGNGYATSYSQLTGGGQAWYNAPNNTSGAGAALTLTQAMTLDASGNLGIGTSSPTTITNYKSITIDGSTGGILDLRGGGTLCGRIVASSGGMSLETGGGSQFINFYTGGTERARIDSSGVLCVGQTSFGFALRAGFRGDSTSVPTVEIQNESATGKMLTFRTNGESEVGSVSFTNAGVLYNVTSDYRRKSNVQNLTGSGTFIDALKPRTFDWDTGDKGVGFIAHEFAEVSPSSVNGEKDAVDADGKPVYQAMQASSAEVIANLVAELQSVRQRLAALEA